MAKFIVDYGHTLSGADTGAGGCGKREEFLTREVGRKLIQRLKSTGHTVLEIDIPYANSVSESLSKRKNIINTSGCDLAISIHFNAFNGKAKGTEVWCDGHSDTEGKRIVNNLSKMGYANRGVKNGKDLAVVGGVNKYALLVECCFIDNVDDMNLYNADSIAEAIFCGIVNKNFEIKEKESMELSVKNFHPQGLFIQGNSVRISANSSVDSLYKYFVCDRIKNEWVTIKDWTVDKVVDYKVPGYGKHSIVVHRKAKNSNKEYDDLRTKDIIIEGVKMEVEINDMKQLKAILDKYTL